MKNKELVKLNKRLNELINFVEILTFVFIIVEVCNLLLFKSI